MKKHTATTLVILLIIISFGALIRLYKIDTIPISLHGDEVGVGYNAYSLFTAGLDEYGNRFPMVFRADVAPLIFYATVPSIALFGTSEFAVRFPSVAIGLVSLIVFYLVIENLFDTQKALLATFLLAISPWHIQISRIAHDAPYGLLLQLIAVLLFLWGKERKKIFMLLSFIFFGLSFYAYHSPRLTSPLLLLGLLILFRSEAIKMKSVLLYGLILFLLVITPITLDFVSKPITATRISGISIFTREDTSVPFSLMYMMRLIPTFILNYANQFNPYFLFFDSSTMRYFNVRFNGLAYFWELPALLVGAYLLHKTEKKSKYFVYFWIFIAVLPGSLTRGNPNGGRIFMLLPMLCFVESIGILTLINKKIIPSIMIMVLVAGNLLFFGYWYFIDSQKTFAPQWQYGLKQAAQKIIQVENQFNHIIVTDKAKQAYIYILFYGNKNPVWLKNLSGKKRHPFIGYEAFDKYEFRAINWESDQLLKKTLLVGTPDEILSNERGVDRVMYPTNQAALYMVSTP